jgi:spore coat polysaccharide biosynthesis protein SpsF
MRKLIASIVCRNKSTRLYGKPLQNLDIENRITILEYMINFIRTIKCYDEIVLGISEGIENLEYIEFAKRMDVPYIVGSEDDVLGRTIQCGERAQATDLTPFTSESPFTYFEALDSAWKDHVNGGFEATFLDNVPDGSGFGMLSLDALRLSHSLGDSEHREHCSLYIRENKEKFKIRYVDVPLELRRTDLRLTVDYPEDLVVCRAVYAQFKDKAPRIPVNEIIAFLDKNPNLKDLVDPFVDEGLKTMYL